MKIDSIVFRFRYFVLIAVSALCASSCAPMAFAQGTAFTYQGRLTDAGSEANGTYDLAFTVFGGASGGSPVAGPITNSAVAISNGLFTVTLNFGSAPFSAGVLRWLEIGVRTNGGGAFTTLNQRQQFTATPYAITASNITSAIANSQLANSSITVTAGTGLGGGGSVPLGGSTTLSNRGILSVVGNSDITASTLNGAVTLGDTATSTDTPGALVKRDLSGNFSTATLSLDNNLILPATTATAGIIYAGGSTLIHDFGGLNFFGGKNAGNLAMIGSFNTGVGSSALSGNTSGNGNVAVGDNALAQNTSGTHNTAVGLDALVGNLTPDDNTAIGAYALQNNTAGNWNTAVGSEALSSNTNGASNTAVGFDALENSKNGNNNTAVGTIALQDNLTGVNNTAAGAGALARNVTGIDNSALGESALDDVTSGSENIGLGAFAGLNLQTGSGNIMIGVNSGSAISTGNNNIDIGNAGFGDESGVIRIGTSGTHTKAVFLGIFGTTVGGGAPVQVNASGLLGTVTSSRRFKQNIQSMDEASDVLFDLHPVTFKYKSELDPEGTPQFGLVAEDVEKVDPALVVRDDKHQVYSVRYDAVNAMLLNEFLKEHRKIGEQQKQIETQAVELQELRDKAAQVDALQTKLEQLERMVKNLAAHQ